MPFNGSGTYSLPAGNPVTTGTVISSTTQNNTMADVAVALSTAITKDGQTTPTANIPMGGFKLTGLAAPTVAGDALRFENIALIGSSIQNQTYVAFTTGGTSTAYTLTPTPAITAYTAGQSFFVTFNAASGAAPTLAISAVATPPNLVKQNADGTYSNIAALDIPANHRSRVTLLSTTQAWVETMPTKRLAQVLTTQTGTVATGTTTIPLDNTIPQNTEGDQYMSLAITPLSAGSTLEIDVAMMLSSSVANNMTAALFVDSTANALAAVDVFQGTANGPSFVSFKHTVTSGSTSAQTFKVRAGGLNPGTTTFNGSGGGQLFGGVIASRITIKEYLS